MSETAVPNEQTRQFTTGATRDQDTTKLDYEGFLSPLVLRRYAEYMHSCRLRNVPAGLTIRESDNWQKGIPRDAYIKSAFRHFHEWWMIHDGYVPVDEKGNPVDLETALVALFFNVQGYLHELLKERGYAANKQA